MKGGEPIFYDKGSKTGVLLLHGFTSTPYQFKDLAKYLADKGLTVYAPLIAGHGTSPEDLIKTTPKDWKKSVKEAYLDLKKKTEKVFVVGNSFGGNLAFSLARDLDNSLPGIVSLGTPIFLRFQSFIKARLYLYGWAKKYYRKPQRIYKADYTDMMDEITYPLIPIKSLRDFLDFLREETIPNLKKIRVPTLIIHANVDPVANPKSALYIYENLGSSHKFIYWVESSHHVVFNDQRKEELFRRIYNFIQDLNKRK